MFELTPAQRAHIRRTARVGVDLTGDDEASFRERYFDAVADGNPFACEAERLGLADRPAGGGRTSVELRMDADLPPGTFG